MKDCADVCELIQEALVKLGFDIKMTDGDHQGMLDILAQKKAQVVRSEVRDIPATNEMQMFVHCGQCLAERPPDQSPRDFAQLEVGMTALGFQVWCKRHEINVLHVDYQGHQHPANTNREG